MGAENLRYSESFMIVLTFVFGNRFYGPKILAYGFYKATPSGVA